MGPGPTFSFLKSSLFALIHFSNKRVPIVYWAVYKEEAVDTVNKPAMAKFSVLTTQFYLLKRSEGFGSLPFLDSSDDLTGFMCNGKHTMLESGKIETSIFGLSFFLLI